MRDQLEAPPDAVMLVAACHPTEHAQLDPEEASVPGPGHHQMVGLVSLAFNKAGRESFATLEPPGDLAYLSNMTTSLAHQRCTSPPVWATLQMAQASVRTGTHSGEACALQDRNSPAPHPCL